MAGSSESAFLFLDTKNGAIAPVVIIHLLLQQPLISLFRFNAATEKRHSPVALWNPLFCILFSLCSRFRTANM